LRFSNLEPGEIMGLFFAWGLDGKVYFVQATDDDPVEYQIRRFVPDPQDAAITIVDIGDPVPQCDRLPDWTVFSGLLYVTFWGDKTYSISPAATTRTVLTGGPGDAPGGRAICTWGERLMIGGIDDARFTGAHGNRVVYSEAADPGNIPDLNFFDVGADNLEIGGLYPQRDGLSIMLEDQTLWTFSGIPGFNDSERRQTGYQKGSGGIRAFTHDNGAVDPAQVRLWFFDHVSRSPARWSGAAMTRLPGFGVVSPDRTSEGVDQGVMAVIGGPDEFIMDSVAMPRTDSEVPNDTGLVFVRINGAAALVERTVLTGRN
jgi:hypothetical protein